MITNKIIPFVPQSIDELKNEKIKTEKCLKFYEKIFFSFLILLISFIIFIFTKLI